MIITFIILWYLVGSIHTTRKYKKQEGKILVKDIPILFIMGWSGPISILIDFIIDSDFGNKKIW